MLGLGRARLSIYRVCPKFGDVAQLTPFLGRTLYNEPTCFIPSDFVK